MANFCWDCCEEHLEIGGQLNDMKNLCKPGELIISLCEGCGEITVDSEGKRVDFEEGMNDNEWWDEHDTTSEYGGV